MARYLLGLCSWFGLLTPLAHADGPSPWSTERRIIGRNDLEPIENVADTPFYEWERIVARVEDSDGQGYCSGFRVGANLFLTNYHCYDFKNCDGVLFRLGYEKKMPLDHQLFFQCRQVLAKSLTYDYALYQVEFTGNADAVLGKTKDYNFQQLDLPLQAPGPVSKAIQVDQDGPLVEAKIRVKLKHPHASEITLALTSPAGQQVTLGHAPSDADGNVDWTFSASDGLSALAGKPVQGTWMFSVSGGQSKDVGRLDGVTLTVTSHPGVDQSKPLPIRPEDYPIATLFTGDLVPELPLIAASHPLAQPKEIDRSAECKLRTVKAESVDERQTLTHLCDTDRGSSGTPLLDRETGQVVAMHWGGEGKYNMAISMRAIVDDLRAQLPAATLDSLKIAP